MKHKTDDNQHYERKNGSIDVKRIRQSERVKANETQDRR